MATIDRESVLETIDRLSAYEDTVSVDALKKELKELPLVTEIKWTPLGYDEPQPPDDVVLIVSFSNYTYPLYAVCKSGVFRTIPDKDGFSVGYKDMGFMANAWAVAPKGYDR